MKIYLDDTKLVEFPLIKWFDVETVFGVLVGVQVWSDRKTIEPVYQPYILFARYPGMVRIEIIHIGRMYIMRRRPWIITERFK